MAKRPETVAALFPRCGRCSRSRDLPEFGDDRVASSARCASSTTRTVGPAGVRQLLLHGGEHRVAVAAQRRDVRRTGLAVPEEPGPVRPAWTACGDAELDLADAGVGTVVWATGYRRDLSWLDAPVFTDSGEPRHTRGVTPAPGLYLLGLRWMHTRSSSFLSGVGADAEHVAGHIARYERSACVAA